MWVFHIKAVRCRCSGTNRRGSSSFEAWKQVLGPTIEALRATDWIQGKHLHVNADREFASPKLAQWLIETYRVGSTLRLKRSEYINSEYESQPVRDYLSRLKPGQCRFLGHQTVTKNSEFVMNIALWWKKGYCEPWALMTTHTHFTRTITSYKQRFGVEPMHKDWKTNAFDIEGTRVTDAKRISTMLIPIVLCYILCMLEGKRKEISGEAASSHRGKRTTGLFLSGLSAFCWILRTTQLARMKAFFSRTFMQWLWPERLAMTLSSRKMINSFEFPFPKSVSY